MEFKYYLPEEPDNVIRVSMSEYPPEYCHSIWDTPEGRLRELRMDWHLINSREHAEWKAEQKAMKLKRERGIKT